MTDEQWNCIKHFNPQENWGNPQKLDFQVIWVLDRFREKINKPCIISEGTQGKHSPTSQHYKGKAVDFIVQLRGLSKLNCLLELLRFPFTGVGVYPHWRLNGNCDILGFHVDGREVTSLSQGVVQARWIRVSENGERKYIGFNEANLKKYGIIDG